jgi:hypothetical protein
VVFKRSAVTYVDYRRIWRGTRNTVDYGLLGYDAVYFARYQRFRGICHLHLQDLVFLTYQNSKTYFSVVWYRCIPVCIDRGLVTVVWLARPRAGSEFQRGPNTTASLCSFISVLCVYLLPVSVACVVSCCIYVRTWSLVLSLRLIALRWRRMKQLEYTSTQYLKMSVNLHAPSIYPQYPLDRRLGRSQSRSGRRGEGKCPFFPGIEL